MIQFWTWKLLPAICPISEKTQEGYIRAVVCILMAMSVYKPVAFATRRSSADSTPSGIGKMLVNVHPKSYEGIDEDSTFVTCFLFVLFLFDFLLAEMEMKRYRTSRRQKAN